MFPDDFELAINKPSVLYIPVATAPIGKSELVLYRKELSHLFLYGWNLFDHKEAKAVAKEAGIVDPKNWMGYYANLKCVLK